MLTAIYAALLALLFVILSFRTIFKRIAFQVALGDAGEKQLMRAIRAHANFAEYVPIALIIFAFAEMKGASPNIIHGLGSALLVGRISHAVGVSQQPEPLLFRQFGMVLTFSSILIGSLYILSRSF